MKIYKYDAGSTDGRGGVTEDVTATLQATVWASLKPMSAEQKVRTGQVSEDEIFVCEMDWRAVDTYFTKEFEWYIEESYEQARKFQVMTVTDVGDKRKIARLTVSLDK